MSLVGVGWSMGCKRPFWDESGVMHYAVSEEGSVTCRLACGAQVMVSGQLEGKGPEPDRGHPCGNCVRTARRLARASTEGEA